METPMFHHTHLPSDLFVWVGLGAQIIGIAQTLTNTWLNVVPSPEKYKESLHYCTTCHVVFLKLSTLILFHTEKKPGKLQCETVTMPPLLLTHLAFMTARPDDKVKECYRAPERGKRGWWSFQSLLGKRNTYTRAHMVLLRQIYITSCTVCSL